MTLTSTGHRSAATRSRRSSRPTGEDRERAILATAEQLLDERGFDHFGVDDLARGAGLSRSTFYFYFASKEAVVLSLLDAVIAESERSAPAVDLAGDPVASWRAMIRSVVEVFGNHRAVVAAAVEARGLSPELRALWAAAMQHWIERTTALIKSERRKGAAPKGRRARDLAVALNLMNERVLVATFTGESPAIAESEVVDTLLGIWLPAIYGSSTV